MVSSLLFHMIVLCGMSRLFSALKRICCRCGSTYSVSQSGKHVRKEECNYHYGKGVENRGQRELHLQTWSFTWFSWWIPRFLKVTSFSWSAVPGGVETRYSCCQGVMGAPACQLFKVEVQSGDLLHKSSRKDVNTTNVLLALSSCTSTTPWAWRASCPRLEGRPRTQRVQEFTLWTVRW